MKLTKLFMFNIKELAKETGLEINFVYKCVSRLDDILKPHITKGDKNSLLFKPGAHSIFAEISRLKKEDLSITEIKKHLEKAGLGNIEGGDETNESEETEVMKLTKTGDLNSQSRRNTIETEETYFKSLAEANKLVLDEKQKLIDEKEQRREDEKKHSQEKAELQKQIQVLAIQLKSAEVSIKLLPGERTPEELRKEWEEKLARKADLARTMTEYKKTSHWRPFKRGKLWREIQSLTDEIL